MKLESVDAYNARKQKERREREEAAKRTGVACPKCGEELEWTRQYPIVAQFPLPSTAVACCKKCSLQIELEK